MKRITNFCEDTWELIPSNVKIYVCEYNNPQQRIEVYDAQSCDWAFGQFNSPELWYQEVK
jgi:hypothetical protein